MTSHVRGLDDYFSIDEIEPRRRFSNFIPVWWCATPARPRRERGEAQSELIHLLYPSHTIPYPSFVTDDERRVVERELDAIEAVGNATTYLATAVLEWARQSPNDPDVAEALSRIVHGWRRACTEPADADLSRRSFQTLHRQFPKSEWAKRTPYWYR